MSAAALSSIPQHYTTEFETNWIHKAQQLQSALKSYVTIRNFTGKRMRCNLIEEMADPEEITERAGDTKITNEVSTCRWIQTKAFDKAILIDEWDEELLGQVSAPNSEELNGMFAAFERHLDTRIVDAVSGTAYEGEDGDSAVTFDLSNQQIAANYKGPGVTPAVCNLTIEKLIKIKSMYGINNVTGNTLGGMSKEKPVLACTQYQKDALLRLEEVTSAEYAAIKALVTGEVDEFLGIRFVTVEPKRLPKVGNSRYCYSWVPSGVRFSAGGYRVNMDIRADRSHALQIRVRARDGGVRMEEKKAILCLCDESVA